MSNNNDNKRSTLFGASILVLTAFIWGLAFVAQRYGVGYIDSVSISGLRYVIATGVLGLTVLVTDLVNKYRGKTVSKFTKDTLIGGVACGVVLFVSTLVQQIGLESTTSGKAGFITTLYIVMVPIINLISRKRTSLRKCIAVLVAMFGFTAMCAGDTLTISRGDGLVFYSAITFGFHIVFVDMYCTNTDPTKLTFIQFLTCAVLGVPTMAINGFPTGAEIQAAILPVLYIGIMSSGIAYTLQAVGQKRVGPSSATLIMSLESVVALVGGMIILHEKVTVPEFVGCLLVLVSVFASRVRFGSRFLKLRNSKYFVN